MDEEVLPACHAGWSARSGAPPLWRSAPWAAGSSDPRLSDACHHKEQVIIQITT